MGETPITIRQPVRVPLYVQSPNGDFIEVGAIETFVDVTVQVRP